MPPKVSARPIKCLFPGCASRGFGSQVGLRIHQQLKGHQAPHDSIEKGDGPQPAPRHPALRQDADATTTTVTLARAL